MNSAITTQLEFFLVSTLWGAIILFVYDGFRILRRVVKQNEIIIALEDLVFWVFAGVFIFAMMYHLNDGIIRGYSVMGMTIGMLLYNFFDETDRGSALSDYLCDT
jgi:spore cortex biosynthesis protein YabQ